MYAKRPDVGRASLAVEFWARKKRVNSTFSMHFLFVCFKGKIRQRQWQSDFYPQETWQRTTFSTPPCLWGPFPLSIHTCSLSPQKKKSATVVLILGHVLESLGELWKFWTGDQWSQNLWGGAQAHQLSPHFLPSYSLLYPCSVISAPTSPTEPLTSNRHFIIFIVLDDS